MQPLLKPNQSLVPQHNVTELNGLPIIRETSVDELPNLSGFCKTKLAGRSLLPRLYVMIAATMYL
jgi:hypothetical protein